MEKKLKNSIFEKTIENKLKTRKMKVTDYLTESTIIVGLDAQTKKECLDQMLDVANTTGKIKDLRHIKEVVFEREALVSTGVGHHVAIPHGKSDDIDDEIMVLAILKQPIDWESVDNEPVKIVLLIVGKNMELSKHIKVLSRTSRLLCKEDTREYLEEAGTQTPASILTRIKEEEEKIMI